MLSLGRSNFLISAVLFLGIFTILALRSWDAFSLPVLAFEDGRDMFAFYFNNGSPAGILRFYNGYVSILPNAIGWTAMRLPLSVSVHIFTLASLVNATLGFYLLSLKGHAWLVPEASTRRIIALALTILPLGSGYMISNLTYSQWSLLFLLIVLLTRWPLPSSFSALSVYSIAVAICAVSHPLSIMLLPLCVLQFIFNKRRNQRLFIVLLAIILVVYQALGVEHGGSKVLSLHSILWGTKIFAIRVCCEALFGVRATTLLAAHDGTHYLYAFGITILSIIAFLISTSKHLKRDACVAGGMLVLALALVLISTVVRYPPPDDKPNALESTHFQRYVYVSKLIFATLVLWQLVPRIQSSLRCQNTITRAALLVAISMYVIGINEDNQIFYGVPQKQAKSLRDFIHSASTDLKRAQQHQPYQSRHVLDRGGEWDIVLLLDNKIGDMKDTGNGMKSGK